LIVSDFAREVRTYLEKRRASHVASLISEPEQRLAGRIVGIDEALSALESIKKTFLTKSDRDEDDAE
jgi:hypothetical protein